MRELHDHKVNGLNESIRIEVLDECGAGNANHRYHLSLRHGAGEASEMGTVQFQNGPIAEAGINGISDEALLAIVIDRLRGFQSGPFACRENALALTRLEECLHWLNSRSTSRLRRGVEGTHEK